MMTKCILALAVFVSFAALTKGQLETISLVNDIPNVDYKDVFVPGDGVNCPRIPSVIQTASGALLAFAEGRKVSCSDGNPKGVIFSRSTDGGSTWTKQEFIVGGDDPDAVLGNTAPVFDTDTNTTILQYTVSDAKHLSPGLGNFQMVSQDDGETWSDPVDIGSALGKYVGTMAGPGVGVLSTEGRLLWAGHWGAYDQDVVWYSDNGGKDYTLVHTTFPEMDEPIIVQLKNGTVLLNMRNKNCKCRATAMSDDGGETWTGIRYRKDMIDPTCQASMVRIGDSMFFSNANSESKRSPLVVQRSDDDTESWSKSKFTVWEGPGMGYTQLVPGALSNAEQSGLGGLLFERNVDGQARISFASFPLDF